MLETDLAIQRSSGWVLLSAALLVLATGCGADKASAPAPAASPPPVSTTTTTTSADDGGGGGDVVSNAALAQLTPTLPKPKGAPASGAWKDVSGAGGDGDRQTNFVDGKDYWVGVRFLDCRAPFVKKYANEPADKRGDLAYCFDAPTGKFKDYPSFSPHDTRRVVVAGNLTIIADLGVTGQAKLETADLEAFLESLDLAAIAKL